MHHAHLDKFAYQDSVIHRLDARAKFVAAIVFTVAVIAGGRESLALPACYAIAPFTVLVIANIPLRFVVRHIVIVSPFVLMMILGMLFFDRTPISIPFASYTWNTTAGTVRGIVVAEKFVVTMTALLALVSTTRFSELLGAMRWFKIPELLVIQLGFVYRYIFVLMDKAMHILRARRARTLRRLSYSQEFHISACMVGSLLRQSIESAQQTSMAMTARGFDGTWRNLHSSRFGWPEWLFLICTAIVCIVGSFMLHPVMR